MSFERAYVNCEHCYTIASNMTRHRNSTANNTRTVEMYRSRDNAMQALEHATGQYESTLGRAANSVGLAGRLMEDCMTCTRASPRIVHRINGTRGR